jgi:putative membrane protein
VCVFDAAVLLTQCARRRCTIQKQEAVYGILDADGRVESVYIVNRLHGGSITDYGRYTAVENLTTPEALTQNGDEITLQTEAEVLYYQGTAETKELPWSISLDYILNGTEVTASQLAGSSGTLQIHITVKQNAAVQETFFLNYALQVGVLLDTDLCTNIETTDATIAQAGGDQQLSHTILPGTEADILITADVRDFEMDAVTFNGIRMSMNLDLDHSAFSQQLTDLSDAIAQLDDGAGELRDGAVRLSEGLTDYVSGLKAFAAGLSELYSGVSDLNAGASELSEGLSALCSQSDLLVSGALQIQQSAFDAVNQQLSESGMGLPVLTPDNYKAVLENIRSFRKS